MIQNNRIIYSDNGVLTDYSVKLNDFRYLSGAIPMVASEDILYVGSDLPFNHRYIEMGTVNTNSISLLVDLWDGKQWEAAVDIIDQTSGLAQSGHLSWQKSKYENWVRDDTDKVTGLTSIVIYNMYWARIKVSANLSAGTTLSFMGQKFSDDASLAGYWPELTVANTYLQWPKQPKTTWDEQHYEATEVIIRDLKKKGEIATSAQVLNWELFKEASSHKTAEIIMNSFGKDYVELRDKAAKYYDDALNMFIFHTDKNNNTLIDPDEAVPSLSLVRR